MKTRVVLAIVVVLALGLAGSILLSTQTISNLTAEEIVARVKPGQWVEIKGIVQTDSSVLALEFKFLTGGMGDDDWELTANVQAATPTRSEFQVLSVPVKITKNTKLNNPIKSLDDIQPEMLVKLEGTYRNDSIFVAKDVAHKTAQLKANPQLEAMMVAVGKIGHVDEVRRMVTVMGIQVHITEKTNKSRE